MLHHQDVGYWGFKDLWVQVQIWWTWKCHSSRMLRILGSSRTAPDLVNLEITPHQDVGYWGFYGSLRYNPDLGSGPDTVNTKMSTPRMLDIATLGSILDTQLSWGWSHGVLVRTDPSWPTRPGRLGWPDLTTRRVSFKMCGVLPSASKHVWILCGIPTPVWPSNHVTTAMDGHVPITPRMVTYRKKIYYRLGIRNLNLTPKTRARW